MDISLPQIRTQADMEKLIDELGFLPFFQNEITGFSIEDACPTWYEQEGPWEWKGPVASKRGCIYGKLFRGKAGFVRLDLVPDFVNLRRDGYNFDSRYEDGLAQHKDKVVYDTIAEHGALLTDELKALTNFRKGGNTGFETVITRLQMQTYVVIEDFRYRLDKNGSRYGWGVASYATPEKLFGEDFVTSAYSREPEKSREIVRTHLRKILPNTDEKLLLKLIG